MTRRPQGWPVRALALLAAGLLFAHSALAGEPLRLHGVVYLGDLPTLVAHEEGVFTDHGLEPTIRFGHSGMANLQALLGGDTDVALMAPTPLALHQVRHPPDGSADDPVILASLVHATQLDQLLVLEDSPIRRPEDLHRRRVGLMHGTNAEFMFWLYTAFHGLEAEAIELVDARTESLGRLLIDGEIDAAVIWEPWAARLKARHAGGLRQLSSEEGYTAKWLLVTRRGFARDNPVAIRRLLAAYAETIDRIEDQPLEALRLYARHAELDDRFLPPADALPLFGLGLDWSLLATLQQHLAWIRATNRDGAGPAPRILDWIESGPLRDVAPTAVGIPAPVDEPR